MRITLTLGRLGDCFWGDVGAEGMEPDAPAATRLLFPTLKILVSCCCQDRYRCILLVIYDFPRAGKPTIITTSLAPTSRCAILPSGETLDLVIPGIFNVVAGGRVRGVEWPEFCLTGGLFKMISHES